MRRVRLLILGFEDIYSRIFINMSDLARENSDFSQQSGDCAEKCEAWKAVSLLMELSEKHRRFPAPPSDERVSAQLENREKMFQQMNFPPFDPKNEGDFEDYIDRVSASVSRYIACPAIFLEA